MTRLLERLRSTPRRIWWTTFALFFALGTTWAFTSPQFGAGDEAAHASRAVALSRGSLTGEKRAGAPEFARYVDVPAVYTKMVISGTCYFFDQNTTPSCAEFHGSSDDYSLRTDAGRHPPAYYAYVGLLSAPFDPLVSIDMMRVLTAALCAALLASAVVTLRSRRSPALAAAGLAVAVTPTALYLMGVVNPNGPEVAAGIALWISGYALVARSDATDSLDARLIGRVTVAASVLVLTRQTSPLWLLIIGGALVACSRRETLRAIWRSHAARWGGAVIGACLLLQAAWILIVKPLDVTYPEYAIQGSLWSATRLAIGDIWPNYIESIGALGWFNEVVPTGVIVLWTALLALLVGAAWVLARRRLAWVLVAVVTVVVVLPAALEAARARDAGLFWQGRYTLPLAVGVPILSAVALAESPFAGRLRRLAPLVVGAVVVGQVVSFGQQLRRWTVGYRGNLDFAFSWDWSRAAPPWLLLFGFAGLMVALAIWLVAPDDTDRESRDSQLEPVSESATTSW